MKTDGNSESWNELARDEDSVKTEMLDYMPFAWTKANERKSLSAERSLEHMSAWLWLIGRDSAAIQISKYHQYGKPQLRAICEAFGWDWRQWDDGRWTEHEMEEGEPPPKTGIKLNDENDDHERTHHCSDPATEANGPRER